MHVCRRRTNRVNHLVTTSLLAGLLFPILLTGTLVMGTDAAANEVLVESLSHKKFAPLWPGGTFSTGDDNGFEWARVVTDGSGKSTLVANVRPYHPMLDASGKFVKVWVKVDEVARLAGMEFRLSSDRFASNFFAFSFPMYDDPDFNIVRDGVWTTLTFSFGSATVDGTPDRSKINSIGWYVADKGGEKPVTAHWGGLALVDEPTEGVISITFDDGYDEHYKAAEIMSKYGFRGTAYIIPRAIGQANYMNLHQLVDLQVKYGWDVAAHHEKPFTDMSPDELESSIMGVQRYLIENEFGDGAAHLAYPLGKQNVSVVRPLVRKHFATARVAAKGPETLPPADPHLLRVFNVTHETTPQQIGEAAQQARQNKEWLILMMHYLVGGEATDLLQYTLADFKLMLDEIEKTQVRVLPLAEVWSACTASTDGCRFGSGVASLPPR
jgi:peptidoglycan/xylan/chitin deacetylase (PgdA/CDA1 family)